MKKTWIWIIIIATVALATVLYITQTKKDSDEIKIGAILPMTGPSSLLGELARNGLTIAENDINNKGGINGRQVKIYIEDGMADPSSSVSAFRKLVTLDKVKFVVTTHSSVSLAISPLADRDKIILFVHASHPQITGKSPYIFRHSNIAEQESQEIVDFVQKENMRTYSIAVMDDDYGIVFRENLIKLFLENNISIVSDVVYEKTETDFKTVAQKLLLSNQNPEIIVIAGLGNGVGLLIRRLKEFGYEGDILITLGAVITGAFESAGKSAKGIYYIDFRFDSTDKDYQDLSERYYEKYKSSLQSSSVLFYNTLMLLGHVIEKVDEDPHKVSKYLKTLEYFRGIGEEMEIVNNYDIVPSLQVFRK